MEVYFYVTFFTNYLSAVLPDKLRFFFNKKSNVLKAWEKTASLGTKKFQVNNVGAMKMFYKRDLLLVIILLAGGISRRYLLKRLGESCKKNSQVVEKGSITLASVDEFKSIFPPLLSHIFLKDATCVKTEPNNILMFTILCVWQTIYYFHHYFPFFR